MRAALIQMRSGADRKANVAALRDGAREAAGMGATYVQTPEMTGMIAPRDDMLAAAVPERDDPVLAEASRLASEHRVWVHIGSTAVRSERERGKLANRALLFAPDGSLRARYDKLHMFDVDLPDGETWRESAMYAAGDAAVVAEVDGTMLGMGICYDLRFPALFAAQARAGATVLTVTAAFTAQTGRAHWDVLCRARAIECGAFLLAAAQGGHHEDGDGRRTWGRSIVVDPWGAVIGMLDHDEPGVLCVDIDPARSAEAHSRIRNLDHARDFALRVEAPVREAAQ